MIMKMRSKKMLGTPMIEVPDFTLFDGIDLTSECLSSRSGTELLSSYNNDTNLDIAFDGSVGLYGSKSRALYAY